MTINSLIDKNQYTADGAITNFTYQFRIIEAEDIKVILTDLDGNDILQILGVHYTVTDVNNDMGGEVVFNVAPPNGYRVTLVRGARALQPEHYVENDAFPAATHELILDRITTVNQTVLEECSRAIQVPHGTLAANFNNMLPPIIPDNAGKVIALNANATGFEFVDKDDGGGGPVVPGDVIGPNSSTDNAVVRFDGLDGKHIQNSTVIISDHGTVNVTPTVPSALEIRPYGTNQNSEVRFYTSAGNYASIKAPIVLGANTEYTLPNNNGAAGYALTTDGSGNLSWADVSGGGGGGDHPWHVINSNQTIAVKNNYIVNNPALITLTLPVTAAVGDVFKIVTLTSGGFLIEQNAGQNIIFGDQESSVGVLGYVSATEKGSAVEVVCVEANTKFLIVSAVGNLTLN